MLIEGQRRAGGAVLAGSDDRGRRRSAVLLSTHTHSNEIGSSHGDCW